MDVNGQSYQNWWNGGTLNPPWRSASIISQSSLRSFKQISTCNSPQPAMTCSPLSSVLQTTNWSDFESRFKPSTNLGRSLPSWRNWGSFCQTGAGKVFFCFFFGGGLIGCELIRVYLLIDVDSWIIGYDRLLSIIVDIPKHRYSRNIGNFRPPKNWWCLVPVGPWASLPPSPQATHCTSCQWSCGHLPKWWWYQTSSERDLEVAVKRGHWNWTANRY